MKIAKKDREIMGLKLANNLESLATEMLKVSMDMQLFGGETAEHGKELTGAAGMVHGWVEICNKRLKV